MKRLLATALALLLALAAFAEDGTTRRFHRAVRKMSLPTGFVVLGLDAAAPIVGRWFTAISFD